MLLTVLSAFAAEPVVAIVPGCPSEEDGTLSHCQERRLAWVAHLWETGEVTHVITSGAAAYNPYVEADVMADALVAWGIPADRVLRERNALHTDQNIAWSLAIAEEAGFERVVVATDLGQAQHGCAMIRAWSTAECRAESVDYRAVRDTLKSGAFAPKPRAPEAQEGWIPLEEREARIAATLGAEKRRSSMAVYTEAAVKGLAERRPAPFPESFRTPE